MYGWLWQRLPGPTPVRVLLAAAAAAAAVALLLLVVFPALHPGPSFRDGSDPAGADSEQVVEPDGVRSSPLPLPDPAEPSPVVPEDQDVPQQ